MPLPGAFIAQYIIILYEDDNTVIKYIYKANLYLLTQPPVSSHTFDIPVTHILCYKKKLIDEPYDHVNPIHIVHFHHLYMKEVQFLITNNNNKI